jgi:hypothetical protein
MPARPAIFSSMQTSERGGRPRRSAGALTSLPGGPASPSPPYSTLGVERSFGSVRSNFLPLCEAASKGSLLSPRGHRICEEVEHFGSAWQVGTFGSAAGCKRGLAIPGFRKRNHEHGETESTSCARGNVDRTDLHPAHRPTAAVDYAYPSGKCGSDFPPHRTAGAEPSRSSRGYPHGSAGQTSRPHGILETDGRRVFYPVEVWVKLPATGTCEDGANTVVHPPAGTAWLSILATFAHG